MSIIAGDTIENEGHFYMLIDPADDADALYDVLDESNDADMERGWMTAGPGVIILTMGAFRSHRFDVKLVVAVPSVWPGQYLGAIPIRCRTGKLMIRSAAQMVEISLSRGWYMAHLVAHNRPLRYASEPDEDMVEVRRRSNSERYEIVLIARHDTPEDADA